MRSVARGCLGALAAWCLITTAAAEVRAPVTVTVDLTTPSKYIQPLLFGTQIEFFQKALDLGTRPTTDPTSQRAALARALREAGVRALRFPGGTPAEWYIWRDDRAEAAGPLLAHVLGSPPGYHTPFDAFMSFARDEGFQVIYQLNTAFVADEAGLHAIQAPTAAPTSDAFLTAEYASLYSRDYVEEAARDVEDLVAHARAHGYPVALWEIGNEDEWRLAPADYARLAARYVEAIRRSDPETPIAIPAYAAGTLAAQGDDDHVTYLTTHYPFGAWGTQDQRLTYRVALDADIPTALAALAATWPLPSRLPAIAVTETTVFPYWWYDPWLFVPSQAHAVTMAYHWFQILRDPHTHVAVFHEFVTPFFGLVRYDAAWYVETGTWGTGDHPPPGASGPPQRVYRNRYLASPSSLAFRLLSEAVGHSVVLVRVSDAATERDYLAVADDREVLVYAVNRTAEQRTANMTVAGPVMDRSRAVAWQVVGHSLGATLPGSFRQRRVSLRSLPDGTLRVRLAPYSFTLVRIPIR